jgi:hypothetical protein
MPENPHDKEDLKKKREKVSETPENCDETGAWSEDQKKKSYYYDDAHGYEIYTDEEDEEN